MKMPLLFAMTIAAFSAQAALAHTELAETVPADRATIEAAPEDVQLEFSEPVRLTALSIQKDGASKLSLGPLPAETTEAFTVALPSLDDGHYVVAWRALSEDTHVMSGEFMFSIGAAGSHDAHMNESTDPAAEGAEDANLDQGDDHAGTH